MQFKTPSGTLSFTPQQLIIAGWTGRNRAAVDHHIKELAALGVAPPSAVPLYYRCSPQQLTQSPVIDVLGEASSGEAEPLLIRYEGKTWLGLASDHTDRALEAYSVAHSKQICAKPVADTLWDFNAVSAQADQLELTSWIHEAGDWVVYQQGTLAMIAPLSALLVDSGLQEGEAMLCGTLSAIDGVRPAARFKMALHNPVTGQTIQAEYASRALPIVA